MGHSHGDNVRHPLDLMDYSIRIGHLQPVFRGRKAIGADDLVNLLVDLLCRNIKEMLLGKPRVAQASQPSGGHCLGPLSQEAGQTWVGL